MPNFFEKLKKGMGIEAAPEREGETEEIEEKAKPKKKKMVKLVKMIEEEQVPPRELKIEARPIRQEEKGKKQWAEAFEEPGGQLAIDVYQTENNLVIQSAIAGVSPENLEITMERDIVSIKGVREKPFEEKGDYFTKECYWGLFSRQVIMPVEVDPDRAEASMKEGILTIRIPKILREKKRVIKVRI